jgi:hypothetical protein
MYSTMEKKSLVSKKTAPVSKSNSIQSRHIDLSRPALDRLLTCMLRASGDKRVKYM